MSNVIASLRRRIKREKASSTCIKIGTAGTFCDVTDLRFQQGGSPYYRDQTGSIRSVARDAKRAITKAFRSAEAKALADKKARKAEAKAAKLLAQAGASTK